jgi:hypothetical protein
MTPNEILNEKELSHIVHNNTIQPTQQYAVPPIVIQIGDSPIATLGNFSASTGKAKAKKTFNLSAIVAAALLGKKVLQYEAHLPPRSQRILYIDTEQSRFHCHRVLLRILRLAGLPTDQDCPRLDFISLRAYSAAQRVQLIEFCLRRHTDYGLVIIDGLRDLLVDFNSITESLDIINKLMGWSSRYNLHIHVVLHLNKSDEHARGHIGTELNNKAESVLVITKCGSEGHLSEVRAVHTRDKEFAPFLFTINADGLPEVVTRRAEAASSEAAAPKLQSYKDLTPEQHRQALETAFADAEVIEGYGALLAALGEGYASVGFERKRTTIAQLLNYLQKELQVVQREGKTFKLNRDNLFAQ